VPELHLIQRLCIYRTTPPDAYDPRCGTNPAKDCAACTRTSSERALCLSKLCNGQCVDLQTDRYNCGQCGHICPTTGPWLPMCSAGQCVMCLTDSDCQSFHTTSPDGATISSPFSQCCVSNVGLSVVLARAARAEPPCAVRAAEATREGCAQALRSPEQLVWERARLDAQIARIGAARAAVGLWRPRTLAIGSAVVMPTRRAIARATAMAGTPRKPTRTAVTSSYGAASGWPRWAWLGSPWPSRGDPAACPAEPLHTVLERAAPSAARARCRAARGLRVEQRGPELERPLLRFTRAAPRGMRRGRAPSQRYRRAPRSATGRPCRYTPVAPLHSGGSTMPQVIVFGAIAVVAPALCELLDLAIHHRGQLVEGEGLVEVQHEQARSHHP
jgi:hypothetical protein